MNNVMTTLLNIGFTEYEVKVYKTLLQHNNLSATEVSELSNVPRGRIYNILRTPY